MEKDGSQYGKIMKELKSRANPKNVEGMARFGIDSKNALGVSVVDMRKMAKKIGTDHKLAGRLWASGIHEARILAGMVDDPSKVTELQMDLWAADFDSWDICDQCCSNLFDKTTYAYEKAFQWSKDEREFVKRAGYTMMAVLSVHDKAAGDKSFIKFLNRIEQGANDERNFVKKSVNWALRQIGKRNKVLNRLAIKTAEEIKHRGSPSARWIASDALRELKSEKVRARIS